MADNGDAAFERTYLVLVRDGGQEAAERVKKEYPNAYPPGPDGVFLIKTKQLSHEIAATLKIKGDDRDLTGVVFRLNSSYSGFFSRSLWEWLDD